MTLGEHVAAKNRRRETFSKMSVNLRQRSRFSSWDDPKLTPRETEIMLRNELRTGVAHVGLALRDPEAFAALWNDGQRTYSWPVWAALLATAIAGTTTYGMTM